MNDIQNNIKHRSASPLPQPHQTNGTLAPVTDTPDSLNPPSVPKARIYCLNTRRTPLSGTVLMVEHCASRPSAAQDLVALYSLTPLANAVARFDPVTGKKNTMRKSYQGHIKDLPGKNIIKPDSVIREIIRVPDSEADTFVGPRNIRRLERDTLEGFGVMPGVIPDVPHPILQHHYTPPNPPSPAFLHTLFVAVADDSSIQVYLASMTT